MGELLPGLIPTEPDILPTFRGQQTRLIEFSHILAPLVHGKGSGSRITEEWDPKWKGDLASASSGGQWPQARKTQVTGWKIDDSRCQLCLAATGTLAHQFHCQVTTPVEGWPLPPKKAKRTVDMLSPHRLRLLQTRGMLVLRVPIMTPKPEGDFVWLLEPTFDLNAMDDAAWYFDGSMLNGKWPPLRATGFGMP